MSLLNSTSYRYAVVGMTGNTPAITSGGIAPVRMDSGHGAMATGRKIQFLSRSGADAATGDNIQAAAVGADVSLPENLFSRGAVLSGLKLLRGKTETAPADGEISPHRYNNGILDSAPRTLSFYYDGASNSANPATFFMRAFRDGTPFAMIEWPDPLQPNDFYVDTYRIDDIDHPKSAGEQQMMTVTFQTNGESIQSAFANDTR